MNASTTVEPLVIEGELLPRLLEFDPDQVLNDATRAAQAVARVIATKERPVTINGRQYLEFEDWQTIGRFYGITAGAEGEPEFVQYAKPDGTVATGFRACAVALHRGEVVSRAYALCMDDEEEWATRTVTRFAYVCKTPNADGTPRLSIEDPGYDELTWEDNPDKPRRPDGSFQRRPKKERVSVAERVTFHAMMSMVQTRACAKVLRQVLSWILVMQKGIAPTPAEEMQGPPPEREEPWHPTVEQAHAMLKAIREAGGTSDKVGDRPRVVELTPELARAAGMGTRFELRSINDEPSWNRLLTAAKELRGATGGAVGDGSGPAAKAPEGGPGVQDVSGRR